MSGTEALLSEYANGSERAFRELVTCYINFVFSTALRIVGGDRPLAEDVTQTVFTDLARKAASLPKDIRLGGWLHRHTCFIARKTLRREHRRIAREKQAVKLHSIEDYTESNLAQLALVLDEVINDLGTEDRNAIVLRFFEERDYRSIGEVLGTSEDAARMRVSRAIDKMGALLKRRGFVLTAAGISFVLSGKLASAAPAGLATRIIYVELARPVKASAFLGILREACFTRLNIGLVSAAMILGLLVLLFSARRTGAKALPDPNGKTITPAEFAELAFVEPDDENAVETEPVPSAGSGALPKPSAPPTPVGAPAQIPVKPVAVSTVRPLSTQLPVPISAPAVPMDGGDSQPGDSTQGSQRRYSWPQRPGGYVARRLTPVAARPALPFQTSAPIVFSNSASATLVRVQPNLMLQPQPGAPTRTMAAAEPEVSSPPPPFVIPQSSQPVRTFQRSVNSGRSNDPRTRDRQP
jgi:RNA polymerase sigma factor (sigma-70 family)